MRTKLKKASVICITWFVFMISSCASTQGFSGRTDLHGTVTYDGGKPAPNFELTLSNDETEKTSVSGSDGKFVFPSVYAGEYRISGHKKGFEHIDEQIALRSRVMIASIRTNSASRLFREAEKRIDAYDFTAADRFLDRAENAAGKSALLTMYRAVCLFKQQDYEKTALLIRSAKADGIQENCLNILLSESEEKNHEKN